MFPAVDTERSVCLPVDEDFHPSGRIHDHGLLVGHRLGKNPTLRRSARSRFLEVTSSRIATTAEVARIATVVEAWITSVACVGKISAPHAANLPVVSRTVSRVTSPHRFLASAVCFPA